MEQSQDIRGAVIARFQGKKRRETTAGHVHELTCCQQLTPFVTKKMAKTYGEYEGDKQGPRNPATYLARWKSENGLD
jgi:hypothetical protein